MTRSVRLFALSGLLAVIVPAAAGAKLMSADQLRMTLAGTTLQTLTVRGQRPFILSFEPDGALKGTIATPNGDVFDNGKWWIVNPGNKSFVCWQFERFGNAQRRCSMLELKGNELARYHPRTGEAMTNLPPWKIKTPGPQFASASTSAGGARPAAAPPVQAAAPPRTALDRDPPTIEAPERVAASGAVAEFTAKIRDASQIVEVTVNARPIAIEADGTLRVRRGVPQGRSTIIVAALDEWGNRASRRVTVEREIAAVAPAQTMPVAGAAAPPSESYADIHFGNYYALVIGNNKYRILNKLETAEHDAQSVSRVLKDDYGFEVHTLLNATRGDLMAALTKMRAKLTSNDNLLIYYAGHGELDTIAEQGYWLPIDAQADVPTNWVSVNDITTMVRAIRAKHILVVADSCYSGTLVRAAQTNIKTAAARHAWLRRMAKKRARTAMVSGGLEPVMDGGGAGHSVFAKAFIDALKENRGVIDGQSLFDKIKRPIVVNADQTPQYSDIRRAGHDGGDFLFVRH